MLIELLKYSHFNLLCVCLNYVQGKFEEEAEELTLDGSVDWHGRPAIRAKSGRWVAGTIILCKFQTYNIYLYFFYQIIYFSIL